MRAKGIISTATAWLAPRPLSNQGKTRLILAVTMDASIATPAIRFQK